MASDAPEIVSFDMVAPLQYVGADAYCKEWQQGFEMCQKGGDFEAHDLSVVVGAFEQQGHGHAVDIADRPFGFERSADDKGNNCVHLF